MVRADGATDLWSRVDIPTAHECPTNGGAQLPRTRTAVRLRSLVTGWTLSNAWDMWYVPVKASESPRGATSAWERSFWSQMASNSPKTNDFGAKRSVSRRPITVAVFRRAVGRQRAPAR